VTKQVPENDFSVTQVDTTAEVVKTKRRFFRLPQSRVLRYPLFAFLSVTLSYSLFAGVAIGQMLSRPSEDPVSARVAGWMRDNGWGFVVTGVEWVQYQLDPPVEGGDPDLKVIEDQLNNTPSPTPSVSENQTQVPVTLHERISTQVTPALKGEGVFKTVVEKDGVPVIQVAYMRPDKVHTSYLAAVVWTSGKHVRFEQHPGTDDPGQLEKWSTGITVSREESSGLIATFNGGFKVADSQGGYYQDGITLEKLTDGIASIICYKDGSQDVGMWGRDFSMSSDVVSVRQNLKLLVDDGKLSRNVDSAVSSSWGATLGGGLYVWRSGLGVTADGDFVYVIGDSLSARTLAEIMVKAGVVRGMQLDINRWWVSYMWYQPDKTGRLWPKKPVPYPRPAYRYQQEASRDFFAVYFKP
jgi:hypothetical protein